jgi:hypothetical protein
VDTLGSSATIVTVLPNNDKTGIAPFLVGNYTLREIKRGINWPVPVNSGLVINLRSSDAYYLTLSVAGGIPPLRPLWH